MLFAFIKRYNYRYNYQITSIPVNADFVINDNLQVVVGVNHSNSCTNSITVFVGSNKDRVGVGCLQLNWLIKDASKDLDEIHTYLGGWGHENEYTAYGMIIDITKAISEQAMA